MKHIKLFEAFEGAENFAAIPKDLLDVLTKYKLVKKDYKWTYKTNGESNSTWQLDSPKECQHYASEIYSDKDPLNPWIKYRKVLVDLDLIKNCAYIGTAEYAEDKNKPHGFGQTKTVDIKAKTVESAIKSYIN